MNDCVFTFFFQKHVIYLFDRFENDDKFRASFKNSL